MDVNARLEMLETENATLRERIRQLEQALFDRASLPIEWGLTGGEARLVQALLSRPRASKEQLMVALYSDRPGDPPDPKIVDVWVCKARRKLAPFGIEILTVWGQGYALPIDVRQRFADNDSQRETGVSAV